jgi:S1-C subfamily serine protease
MLAWDDTRGMDALDALLLLLIGLTAFAGWHRGAVQQTVGLLGTIGGLAVGLWSAPAVAELAESSPGKLLSGLGAVVVFAGLGNALGYLGGRALRRRVAAGGGVRTADAAAGATVSVIGLLLAVWFLGVNLATGPFPGLARSLQESAIVRALSTLPAPPPIVEGAQGIADRFGAGALFEGFPPGPAQEVDPPKDADVRAAARAATPSTFQVRGEGCGDSILNEGTSFVVAPGYVVTNAHVIAGTTDTWVLAGGARREAEVVAFDDRLDLAVLWVPELDAPPLRLAGSEQPRGTTGAILGFPGERFTVRPGAVREVIAPIGHDIYGGGRVQRRVYELQASIAPGTSGGPFVLADGTVAGIVFASSTVDDRTAYALVSPAMLELVERGVGRTQAVGTGRCVL